MAAVAQIYEQGRRQRNAAVGRAGGWRCVASVHRELVLVLLLLLCYGYVRQIPAWNEYSRYDLVVALIDDRSVYIDRYHENTGDKAFYDGHYYSDKTPGTSLLAAPVYILIRAVSGPAEPAGPGAQTLIHVFTFVVASIPSALTVLLLLRFLRTLAGGTWALVLSLGYGLGTIVFPFATMFFGHAASSFFLFAAFYLLWRSRELGGAYRPLAAGFLAGWAVLCELPVGLGVVILFCYSLALGRRQALCFVVGGLPLLAVLLGYHWIAFGHPLRLGYQYATVFGEQNNQGLIGVAWPKLSTALDLLFAPRGLLRLSPWLGLAPLGLLLRWQRKLCAELLVCGAMVAAFLLYNSGYFNPFGGWTPGPRYLLPALPFAVVLVGVLPKLFRPLIVLQLAYSLIVHIIATLTMPNAPENIQDPLSELWLPRFASGDYAETIGWLRWGLYGPRLLWPLGFAAALAALSLWMASRRRRPLRWIGAASTGLLAALVLVFGIPFGPQRALAAMPASSEPASQGAITIASVGGTRLPALGDQPKRVELWALLEDRAGVAEPTKVVFTIFTPAGEELWSGWHDGVRWREGERKRLTMEWQVQDVAPGEYQLQLEVVAPDGNLTYARTEQPRRIVVR